MYLLNSGYSKILIVRFPKLYILLSHPFPLRSVNCHCLLKMKFLDWYLKIGVASALVGASMEFFMVKTGFYDKVTVLESEKRAWENSPDAQAVRDALNPWRHVDPKETNKS
ncbi:unnamed protein product [Vicia faba]|uniref:Uncharacterized protein n=2 Tax=Fabeae TaxID=163743 RepID=A0AAV0ZZS0_VICFA|nr:unnamed protein product [Vicia faba]